MNLEEVGTTTTVLAIIGQDNKFWKMKFGFYLIVFFIIRANVSLGQDVEIREVVLDDTVLFSIVDDFVERNSIYLSSKEYILVFIDERCLAMHCSPKVVFDSEITFPLYTNYHKLLRIGLFYEPVNYSILDGYVSRYRSSYLLRYNSMNLVIVSRGNLSCSSCNEEVITKRLINDKAKKQVSAIYDYEIGGSIYRVDRVRISGYEY